MKNFTIRIVMHLMVFTILFSCEKPDNGLTSLIKIENENRGENCSAGGYKIVTGIDKNENGVLDPDEIQDSAYICHGTNGIDGNSILLGETQTGFLVDSVYQAHTDGILIVFYHNLHMQSNIHGGYIYSDQNENPTTIVAAGGYMPTTATVIIPKGNYWRVARPQNNVDVSISWTPINE